MRIRELEEECATLKEVVKKQKTFVSSNPTYEAACVKLQVADELCNKLKTLISDEEKKRGLHANYILYSLIYIFLF